MSTTISSERKEELLADYDELKTSLTQIDQKYSLHYFEPDLDLPSTLGLEPLVFTPLSDEELEEAADRQIAEKYSRLSRELAKKYENSVATIEYKTAAETESNRKKLAELAKEYAKDNAEFLKKAVNNGIFYSTLKNDVVEEILNEYNEKVAEQTEHYNAELSALSEKSEALSATYDSDVAELASRKSAELAQTIAELAEKQENNRIKIEKYNQSLEEKEVKYQASCKKAYRAAVEAEYDRGLQAARLFAELGETGVKQQLLSEKLYFTEHSFAAYTQEEAKYVMSIDSFLSTSLETAYSSLEEYVDTVLR